MLGRLNDGGDRRTVMEHFRRHIAEIRRRLPAFDERSRPRIQFEPVSVVIGDDERRVVMLMLSSVESCAVFLSAVH